MKAVIYEAFNAPQQLKQVPDPNPEPHGVVVKVMATGVCRSDWHDRVGHDADLCPVMKRKIAKAIFMRTNELFAQSR